MTCIKLGHLSAVVHCQLWCCKTSLFWLRTSNVSKYILLVFLRRIHETVWCAALPSLGWLPYRCYKLPPCCYDLPRAGAVRNRCRGFNHALLFTFERTCGRLRVFSSIDNESSYRSSTKTQLRDDKHECEFKIPNSVTNCPTLPYSTVHGPSELTTPRTVCTLHVVENARLQF